MPVDHRQRRRQQRLLEGLRDPCGARRGSGRSRWPARPAGPRPPAPPPRPGRAGAAGAGPPPGCRAAGRGRSAGPRSPPSARRAAPGAALRDASRSRAWIESGPVSASTLCSCGQHRLVGVAGRGQPQPAPLVGGVHRAPLAEPGHHELRDQRHGQLDVERLGEQLARLGQERQPGLPADVGPAQPVVLQVQREPLGGEHGQRPGVRRRARRPAPARRRTGGARPAAPGAARRRRGAAGRSGPAPGGRCPSPRSSRTTPPAAPTISADPGQQARRRSRAAARRRTGRGWSASARSSRRRSGAVPSTGRRCAGRRATGGAGPVVARRRAVQPEPDALAGGQVAWCPSGWRSGRPAAGRGRARRPRRCRSVSLRAPTASSSTGPGAKSVTVTVSPIAVGDDLDVQLGAGVLDRVGGQLGGEQQRLVEQVVAGPPRRAPSGPRARAAAGRTPVGGQPDPPDVLVRAAVVPAPPPLTPSHPPPPRTGCQAPAGSADRRHGVRADRPR